MILPPAPLAVTSGRLPDRWIPAKWHRLQQACRLVLGPPRQVGLDIQFDEVSETVASIVARNSLGPPQAQSNGVAGWILSQRTLQSLEGAAKTNLVRSRTLILPTADQTEVRLRNRRRNPIDYSGDLFSRLEKEKVDLSTHLIATSPAQSNFVAAVRAQIPYGKLLLVLDVRQPESATNRFEFLIAAYEVDAKGNIIHGNTGGK